MRIRKEVSCSVSNGYRANRVRSLFNATKEQGSRFSVDVELPLEDRDWSIGLVVGPSGSGKTTIGTEVFGPEAFHRGCSWSDGPVIEDIGPDAEFDLVTGALSSVGLGTVPSWLRPFSVLSNGEKFRAELARILVDRPERIVIDEFTSVVDRQIAQIGAGAFAKAWRRTGGRAVLLSCHYDIIEWLQPDWVLDTQLWKFNWRSLQRPPRIQVDVFRTNWKPWRFFEEHHYLKLPNMIAATNYVGLVAGEPVAHVAVATTTGLKSARMCRLVVMPEWQGAGVGLRFLDAVAEMWLHGENRYNKPMTSLIQTSHPGLAGALRRRKGWRQVAARLTGEKGRVLPAGVGRRSGSSTYGGHLRAIQSFRYTGRDAA